MDDNFGSILAEIARLLRRNFDEGARDIGITRPQWQVLTVLMRHEGINQGGLADLLVVEPITLCRMVDRLQDAGMVERRRDPADRRAWRLFLTAKAKDILQQLRPLGDQVMTAALVGLSADEQRDLREKLERIRHNLTGKNESSAAAVDINPGDTPEENLP